MRAGELGLSEKEVVGNVITALTSNQMIAPNIWIDPRNNNNYFLNVQYPEASDSQSGRSALDSTARAEADAADAARYGEQHYAYRGAHRGGSLSDPPHPGYLRPAARRGSGTHRGCDRRRSSAERRCRRGSRRRCADRCKRMRLSFRSFALGLSLSVVLLYLVLVAQFRSFIDPFLILLAFPPGITGALLTLWLDAARR